MKAGDIIFVRGNTILSKCIRYFDKGEFSHVAIAVSDTHVLEAQYFTKSRITPMYFTDYEIIDLGFTDEERMDTIKIGIELVGVWYDYFQAISYIFRTGFNNPNHYICSEMIAILLDRLGKEQFQLETNITPNQLYKKLKGE